MPSGLMRSRSSASPRIDGRPELYADQSLQTGLIRAIADPPTERAVARLE